ncbi:MAG TPA: hypothetical protein VLX92_31235 [Kofleriaceae bacterium]|nr:hypothetical protein [Kofleriaceae bacterium]
MNLYVIDDVTRLPVTAAMVQVGSITGSTDATGLFVATGDLQGKQDISVAATGYRSEYWIGANGANITIDLKPGADPAVTEANLSGSITGFDAITVPAGHHKAAYVVYSQDDKATSAENNLTTAGSANICDVATPTGACTFTVTTRTGTVALAAVILDHDLNGTPSDPSDDKYTAIGWATATGLQVQNGISQTGVNLAIVPANQLTNVTVDFGTPPAGLTTVFAVIGVELGDSGVLDLLPELVSPTAPTLLVPSLSAFQGATYRLTAAASNGATMNAPESAIELRALTSTAMSTGTWLAPPTGLTITRTGGSWTAESGALVMGASYDIDATHHALAVTSFDGSTSYTIPDNLAVPSQGTLTGTGTALAGTVDLTNFSSDNDAAKVTGFASQPLTIN